MKRFIAILLSAVFVLSFVACGKQNDTQQPDSSNRQLTPSVSQSTNSEEKQTGMIAEQIISGKDGDIHFSYYLPESYDGTRLIL